MGNFLEEALERCQIRLSQAVELHIVSSRHMASIQLSSLLGGQKAALGQFLKLVPAPCQIPVLWQHY